jgi:phospholipase C
MALPFLNHSRVLGSTGTIRDVGHVVILALENRSFDHYFGCLRGTCGFNDPSALSLQNGNSVLCQPAGNSFLLPFPALTQCLTDVDHEQSTAMAAWNFGKWDQWAAAKGTNSMAYYTRADLGFYYALADAYTICDAYFCSALSPTYPNRLYLMTGTIDPLGKNGGPIISNSFPAGGLSWTTYAERLQAAGVSWRVYQQSNDFFPFNVLSRFVSFKNATPGNPLFDRGLATCSNLVATFESDVTNGTLPLVSWILPPSSQSEHPYYSPSNGALLTRQLLGALASNPAVYASTVFIVTYDENGGFFDHVPSPVPPVGTPDEFVYGLPVGLGVRIPTLIISPWTRGGFVCSEVFDHTSVLRFLEAWTGVPEPNISAWRRQICGNLTSAFDFKHPDTSFPELPEVVPVLCTGGVAASVPATQSLPMQEAGRRPRRLSPYQPNATALADLKNGGLFISLTNAGSAAAHHAIYARADLQDSPWQFDVPPGGSVSDFFPVSTNAAGFYDLACYGPNGFQRSFAGTLSTLLEVASELDPGSGDITLIFRNSSGADVLFAVTNTYDPAGLYSYLVSAGTNLTQIFPVVTNNQGWYDLIVTANADPLFARRFAGYLETGLPRMDATVVDGTLVLNWPAWAAGWQIEISTDPGSGAWARLDLSPTISGNRSIVSLPLTREYAYVRLRQ